MAQYDLQAIPTLATALHNQTVETLKSLAKLLGSDKGLPLRKAELVELIQRHLQGESLKVLWARLDTLQQAAVAETVHGPNSTFHGDRFVAKYGQTPNWGSGDRYGYRRTPSWLGLLFYHGIMPDDLKQRFKVFVPKPAAAKLESRDDLPEAVEQSVHVWDPETRKSAEHTVAVSIVRCPTERAACHDLKAVLRLIDAGKLAVSDKTYQPGEAAMKTVAASLLGGDFYDDSEYDPDEQIGFIKPFAWPLLVQAGGLARLNGKRLELTPAGRKALSALPEHTLAQLWQRWLKATLLDELRRIDCIKGQTGKAKRSLTAMAGRRAVIQEALKSCPPERWIEITELSRHMRATGLTFEVARDFWQLYISDPQHGSLGYEGFHDWHIVQGRYMLCLLFEYAATLGLIDVAYIPPHGARPDYREVWGADDLPFFSRYDGLLYFRLNPLGAYCLGLAASYTPSSIESRAVLRVLPNLEIAVISAPLEPADELLLDHYAEKVSDAVWKLEPGRLLEATEAGQSVAVLREWLESHSAQGLPETVARFLDDMAHRAGRLQDQGSARLIECADAALAALIANDTRTKPYCLLAGERHLAVPAESETRFRSALRRLGYSLPK